MSSLGIFDSPLFSVSTYITYCICFLQGVHCDRTESKCPNKWNCETLENTQKNIYKKCAFSDIPQLQCILST